MTIALLIAGLVLLVVGAEWLVRGAARLAAAAGISPLVVGLTVVAFGTSAPELAVSVQSAMQGRADLAVGNVVGSNVFNVLFILGVSALVAPLVVSQQLVRLDVPLMIAASLVLLVLGLDGRVSRAEGALLFAAIAAYTLLLVIKGRRDAREGGTCTPAAPAPGRQLLRNVALLVAGLALLVLGSRWLVESATLLAVAAGVSELVIGLTIVAAGTSLPELATSVLASARGERDIAVGNVVGSNIFNILAVLGVSALAADGGVQVTQGALHFDIPVMIAVAVACVPVFYGHRIERWEGGIFVGYYAAYVTYLVIHATDHPLLPAFRAGMLYFVIPLTVLTLVVEVWRTRHGSRRR